MKRYLALDVGLKRTGLALVDDQTKVATPLKVIEHDVLSKNFVKEIIELINEWEIHSLICGLPIDLKGNEGIAAQNLKNRADEFLVNLNKELQGKGCEPVELNYVDERLSTAQAEKALKEAEISANQRKKTRDAFAAAVIAQSFIDSL